MKNLSQHKQLIISGLILTFFLFFFLLCSRWTPVVGDDWGYAVGGRYTSPLKMAWGNYFSWSGRFLSELWGFAVAPHKHLWNILNACLFTGILGMSAVHAEGNPVVSLLAGIVLILTAPNGLRMQTYTWIMGTTYVIPLLLFLLYAYLLKKLIFADQRKKAALLVMGILNLAIPLYMENAAAMLAGGNALVLLYAFFKDKKHLPHVLVYFIISVIGVCLIKFSPGAVFRMERDHAAFNALSLMEKFSLNWISFIRYTFTNNEWLIRIMSVVMIAANLVRFRKKNRVCTVLAVGALLFGLVQSCSWQLFEATGVNLFYILFELTVPHSLMLNSLGYIAYTGALFYTVVSCSKDSDRAWFLVYLLFCAGGANLCMLISPIFDVRSSLYTVFLFIAVTLCMLQEIRLPEKAEWVLCAVLLIPCMLNGMQYLKLYRLIHRVDLKRQSQIAYYQERPDTEEAYILGFPDQTVHSGNIDESDTYHMEYFKYYYYLDQGIHLNFYYLENYTEEEIEGV